MVNGDDHDRRVLERDAADRDPALRDAPWASCCGAEPFHCRPTHCRMKLMPTAVISGASLGARRSRR